MSHAPGHDVLIAGGGLAGLTLALQLKDAMPDLDVRVIERKAHPVPAAAHKVGESTVEIGAHYFAEVLGLREHLDREQVPKFGFRFFFSEGASSLEGVTELGGSRGFPTPDWQIDRGIFENFLAREAAARGVRFDDGATVKRIDLDGAGGHVVEIERGGARETVRSRWLIDAAGRASLLKSKLDLAEDNAHDANAVWFRVNARLDVDAWVDDPEWRGRTDLPARWRSTNHLCGPGYWLWLIPLASGAHSVGIVADARLHPLETMNTVERAFAWIEIHQPVVHARLRDVLARDAGALLDFLYFRRFSYGCRQVFSRDRWALTGDAGLFLDPFYSPGSDFIAIGNTFITDLIRRDFAGEPIRAPVLRYGEYFRQLYETMLALYMDQYGLFGDARLMTIKVLWDYSYYWGILCPMFFQKRLTDVAALTELEGTLAQARAMNHGMQKLLHEWGDAVRGGHRPSRGGLIDQNALPWFYELNRALRDRLDDGGFRSRVRDNVARMERLGGEIADLALRDDAALATHVPEWVVRNTGDYQYIPPSMAMI